MLPRPMKAMVLMLLLPGKQSAADQGAGDDDPHDLVGAFENLVDAQIAHQFLDAVVMQIAVAAKQLQRIVGDLETAVGDEALGHGRPFRGVGRLAVEF